MQATANRYKSSIISQSSMRRFEKENACLEMEGNGLRCKLAKECILEYK